MLCGCKILQMIKLQKLSNFNTYERCDNGGCDYKGEIQTSQKDSWGDAAPLYLKMLNTWRIKKTILRDMRESWPLRRYLWWAWQAANGTVHQQLKTKALCKSPVFCSQRSTMWSPSIFIQQMDAWVAKILTECYYLDWMEK